jgi:endonuclease/exonuclease/phosphatase family metal-dependent hydrolase
MPAGVFGRSWEYNLAKVKALFKSLLFILFFSSGLAAQTRIMSFNIRYDNPADGENAWQERKAELGEFLRYYHPDFIGLQEALPHQLEFIDDYLQNYAFIGFGRDGKDSESEATPIFYDSAKYEVLTWEVFWLSETPDEVSRGWDAALNRIATYGSFRDRSSGDTLYLINTHFDHMGAIARSNSAQLILDKIIEWGLQDKKLIVMGDLNAEADEEAVEILANELEDAYSHAFNPLKGPEGTFNAFETASAPGKRIDYIFCRNLQILSYRAIDDKRKNGLWISDHLAVMVEIAP